MSRPSLVEVVAPSNLSASLFHASATWRAAATISPVTGPEYVCELDHLIYAIQKCVPAIVGIDVELDIAIVLILHFGVVRPALLGRTFGGRRRCL